MIRYSIEDPVITHFVWPEPLVVDLIAEVYRDVASVADCMVIAKIHQRALRGLFDGDARRSGALRLELIAFCAARGIGADRIATADRIVFWELINLVTSLYRTSSRSRVALAERLHAALGRLAVEPAPAATHETSRYASVRSRTLAARAALA